MSPKKVFALKRKSWLCLSSASLRHNYNKVLVGERWRSSILLGMYNNSKAKDFFFRTPVCQKAVLIFQPFIEKLYSLQSQLQGSVVIRWKMSRKKKFSSIRHSGRLPYESTHIYKKEVPSLRARTQRKGEVSLLLGRRDSSTYAVTWLLKR